MRVALRLAYDGGGFSGWARQAGRRTVQGELEAALRRLGEDARVHGASRTDAGVHARGQVCHADLARAWEPAALLRALDAQLPGDCACAAAATVAADWRAPAALRKTYTYRIDGGASADPFAARYAWRTPYRLDLARLRAAAAAIPGTRDWRAFARRGEQRDDLVREIDLVDWRAEGHLLICTVRGAAFTYRLVRSLVGAMAAVAHGGSSAGDLARALAGVPGGAARQQAPAHGLCLERIEHAQEPDWQPG